jgi:pantothenate kinase
VPLPLPDDRDANLDALARRARALVRPGRRALLGIAGSPGAGKTTLAVDLAARVNELAMTTPPASGSAPLAVHLPMDGYHLANATLDTLGLQDRKGALETFDGWGFVALLRRLSSETGHPVYAPGFDRRVDEPIAGEIAIEPGVGLVIVEGNYLLVDAEPWGGIRDLLDESWFCDTDDDERVRRLIERHELGGRSREAATAWAETVDSANAVIIEATRPRATLVVSGITAAVVADRAESRHV